MCFIQAEITDKISSATPCLHYLFNLYNHTLLKKKFIKRDLHKNSINEMNNVEEESCNYLGLLCDYLKQCFLFGQRKVVNV